MFPKSLNSVCRIINILQDDTVALDRNMPYEVLSIEKKWYRKMTEYILYYRVIALMLIAKFQTHSVQTV